MAWEQAIAPRCCAASMKFGFPDAVLPTRRDQSFGTTPFSQVWDIVEEAQCKIARTAFSPMRGWADHEHPRLRLWTDGFMDANPSPSSFPVSS